MYMSLSSMGGVGGYQICEQEGGEGRGGEGRGGEGRGGGGWSILQMPPQFDSATYRHFLQSVVIQVHLTRWEVG